MQDHINGKFNSKLVVFMKSRQLDTQKNQKSRASTYEIRCSGFFIFFSFFSILGLSIVAQDSRELSFFWKQNVPFGSIMPTANTPGLACCRRMQAHYHPRDPTIVTHPLAGYGFARLPADPRCSTDLVSRCSSCSCEKSPSPYLYRLQSFQRTKMATSLHKINGVLFMGFSYSWEPDSAYKGLLIQLPGWFYTVNLSCFLCTVQEFLIQTCPGNQVGLLPQLY